MIFIPRSWWAPPSTRPRVELSRRERLIVHHTATPEQPPWPSHDLRPILDFQRKLAKMRPDLIDDVPYQFVGYFTFTGLVVVEGVGMDRIGAHIAGKNTTSLGLALVGNFEEFEGSDQRLQDWSYELRYFDQWLSRVAGRDLPWEPHRDYSATLCPGKWMMDLLGELETPF